MIKGTNFKTISKHMVFMKKILLLIIVSFITSCAFAQSKIAINGIDGSKYKNEFKSSDSPYSHFKGMIGDTIYFYEGSNYRTDFLKSDTIWLKPGTKKPILGKHYIISKLYKCTSVSYSASTDGQYIYNQPWQIVDVNKSSDKECMVLKNLTNGDIVTWRYKNGYNYSEKISFINNSMGAKITNFINQNKLYEKNGIHFNEISIASASVSVKFNIFVFLSTNVTLSNKESYTFSEKAFDYNKLLYDESNKLKEIERMKNLGSYSFELVNVQKPKNSQIRYGKMTTVSDKSVTKYSYIDNFISIIWLAGTKDFKFNIENKSGNSLKIEWDEASYIDMSNSASRIFHSGVRYLDRDKSMPATVVPNGTSFEDVVLPTNLTSFSGSDWYSAPLISNPNVYDETKVGKTVKLLLPISVKGAVYEYIYTFKIKWNWEYPELRNQE